MKRTLRRKIFYLLVGVFLLLAPVLATYALGYTFDFSKKELAKTGGIFIKSRTRNLAIFINNNFVKETSLLSSGVLLPGMEPSVYLIRAEKENYQSWSKTAEVTPGIVTELRNILLIPQKITSATSTSEEDSRLAELASADDKGYVLDKKENLIRKKALSAKIISPNVKYFGVVGEQVFFVDKNGFLAKADREDRVETITRPGFYLGDNPFRFVGSPTGDVVVTDSAGGGFLWSNDGTNSIKHLSTGIKRAAFDAEGEKLLITREKELEVTWLKDNPYQPFQKKWAKEVVLRTNSLVQDAAWYFDDNAHVILRTADGIFITEIDGRSGRNTYELVADRTDGLLTIPDYPTKVFYKKGKNYFSIDL